MRPSAPSVVRFSTCKCPDKEQGEGWDKVHPWKPSEVKDGKGQVVASVCARCTLPIFVVCRGCDEHITDLPAHVKVSPACALERSYRIANAPLNTMPSRKAGPGQKALFGDDVMKPKPKRMVRAAR